MRREKGIYQRIMEYDNLRLAFYKAVKGKYYRPDIKRFREDFEPNMNDLYIQLRDLDLNIGHYYFFTVHDPKTRDICASSFPERVLHHAVMNVCEPYFDKYAIYDSYACRKGKGNRKAILRAFGFSRIYDWYLKLDIRKYFDNISHDIMMSLLERRFKDKSLLSIFRKVLDSYHTSPGRGVPIGNLISQHLANFYLGHFDHWIKEYKRIKGYVRYMDDFIIFGDDKDYLKGILDDIGSFLDRELLLELKDNVQLNRCRLGIPFLGFRIFPGYIRLMQNSKRRYIRKFRRYEDNYMKGIWNISELVSHIGPLNAFISIAGCNGFRKSVIERYCKLKDH